MIVEADGGNRIVNCRTVAKSKSLVLGLFMSALANISFGLPLQPYRPPKDMTREEMLALPRYCRAQRFLRDEKWPVSQAEVDKWNSLLGPDYLHLHHYCSALNGINRGQKNSDDRVRHRYFDNARRNILYVQNACEQTFVLMPEFNLKQGYVLRILGKDEAAAREFLKSIRLRPQYMPAYGALSDYYLDLGNLEEAERVLQQGLEHAPNSKLLKKKLAELHTSQK